MSEAPEELNEAAEVPVADAPAPEAAAPDHEDRALAMGWTPKAQFKGDPERWVDAETFVKRGEEFLPFLKANNKSLERAQERAQKEIAALKATISSLADHNTKTEQRAYERATREIQSRLDEAAALGDVNAVRAATDELVDLTREASAVRPAKPDADAEPEELTDWKAENPWFGKDAVMRGAAIEIVNELIADGVTDLGKQLEAVSRRIKAEFPAKFENPRRHTAPAVEGGGQAPRRGGKSYADLPADAKAMCDDFVKRVPGFTRDKYVKDFFG